jgi:UDP-glucose 4-epimerase
MQKIGLEKMKILVTGGAGFIGSNLTKRLLSEGHSVVSYDNMYLGRHENIAPFLTNPDFRFVKADLLSLEQLVCETAGIELVFHLAANSDISQGRAISDLDLRLGFITTYNVLEAMRRNNIPDIIFASSSAIYGEAAIVPTPEDYGPLNPISLYGASKLSSESYISSFVHNYGIQAWIFRYGNVIGHNVTHGVLYDFVKRLKRYSSKLTILGNGLQAKPYIHVYDCIDGMLFGWNNSKKDLNVFNLATDGATSVDSIAAMVLNAMKLSNTEIEHTGGERGWVGDVPQVRLDNSRMKKLGWAAALTSDSAVEKAILEFPGING